MPLDWTDFLASGQKQPRGNTGNARLAQMLMEQGVDSSPIQSPFQGLARLAQAYVGGGMMQDDAAKQQQGNQAMADILAPPSYTGGDGPQQTAPLTPHPSQPPVPPPAAPPGGGLPDQTARVAGDVPPTLQFAQPQVNQQNDPRNAMLASILNNGGPGASTVAGQALTQMGFGKPVEYDATPRYDQNGDAFIVGKDGTVKPLKGIQDRPSYDATSTGVIWDKHTGAMKDRLPDTQSQERVDQEKDIRAAGRPQMSVSVNADRSFGTQLGENAGKILDASHSAAQGGLQAIRTAHQIKGALDSGKVTAGPGATAIQFFNQVAGGNPEKVVETRKTIQGLAQLALAARGGLKGQGQISDYEGRLLQAASAGKIDEMTVPEIRTITDVAERAARISIHQNAANVEKARKAAPKNTDLVDFYNVDEPPAYAPPAKKSGRFTIEHVGP